MGVERRSSRSRIVVVTTVFCEACDLYKIIRNDLDGLQENDDIVNFRE